MRIKQAIILAGGLGKRLGKRSENCPKPMQKINNNPFLDNLIWNLKRHNIKNIILSIGYLPDIFKAYYGKGSNHGVNIDFVVEEEPLGTGGALKRCSDLLDEYFLLLNGDTIFDINYHDLSKSFQYDKVGHLALNYVENVSRYGEVETEGVNIISFKEKLNNEDGYINSGVGIFKKKIIEFIPNGIVSLEKDVFPKLVNRKLLSSKKYKSFFLDIGIPETLKSANKLIPKWKSKSALFLDRDGVINIDHGYVHSMKNFQWINGAKETIKLANDLNILLIVITNQSGIARGFYTENDFKLFSEEINNQLIDYGGHIDATYYCPHHPSEGIQKYKKVCNCRKPKSGMLELAIAEWSLEKEKCFLIGDKDSDIEAAKTCGINSYLFSDKNDNLLEFFKNNLTYLETKY